MKRFEYPRQDAIFNGYPMDVFRTSLGDLLLGILAIDYRIC